MVNQSRLFSKTQQDIKRSFSLQKVRTIGNLFFFQMITKFQKFHCMNNKQKSIDGAKSIDGFFLSNDYKISKVQLYE